MSVINQKEYSLGNEVKKGELLAELINETYFHFCNYLKVGKKKRRDGELIPWSVEFINTDQKSVGENILEVRYSDKFIEKYNLKVSPTDPPIFRFYVSKYDSNSYHKLKNPVTRVEINTISDSDTEKSLKDDTEISLYDHWRLLFENDKAIVAKKPRGFFIGDSMINHLFGIVNDKTKSEETKAFKFNQYTDIAQERKKLYKTVGVVAGTVIALKYAKDIAAVNTATEYLSKNSVLFDARQYLIINEDIPPGIENVPSKNHEFKFASEVLQSALDIYHEWQREKGLPEPYFRKSKTYFEFDDSKFLNQVFQKGVSGYKDFIVKLFSPSDNPYFKNGFDKYLKLRESFFYNLGEQFTSRFESANEFGNNPIYFSNEPVKDALGLLLFNPGSPIIGRICESMGITSYQDIWSIIDKHEGSDWEQRTSDIMKMLRKEINSVWSWVDEQVKKQGKPIKLDLFLAYLIYRNNGDITGSLWDAAVLTKLASRNDPETFKFYDFFKISKDDPRPGKSTDLLLTRLTDPFAPRLSANWVNKNSRDDRLFAYSQSPQPDPLSSSQSSNKNYKPFDRYCAAGDIYHGIGIIALATVTGPSVVQALVMKEKFGNKKYSIKTVGSNEHGAEKNVADLLVAYDIPNVRKILDKYEVI
ncbi:MAG: hypothetical protein UR23_C0042G0007 [Candidatus Roizmanbacteria bacterium GW2011_GWA2_32_13]|uniref:Uncharacterized protein n=1 Tax=Candidatus Roizmanbacteria bacterium GW2011_GWA2_32_13 TaxID=1618475 RepID=A0A0G0B3U1_9BACT|nr:MAG: hypothetical protein UR23_C0042G0007 [Candidatus Roizmanbacteria bacterium GW2011_GWA2_32_13]